MEHGVMSRPLWASERRFPHHHVPDFFTSIQVTQDIPAGVSFGPCVLHNTSYDTIAFIAFKSFDRGKSYVFRVDPDALKSSPLVPWLRMVQAALDTEEQNTEAYLKGGQLYFRTIRNVTQGEELLVWYDEELSHLLGFSDIKTRVMTDGYSCGKCGQEFKHENPFLAHSRFLCAQVKLNTVPGDSKQQQNSGRRKQRSVTDFHNIARDMEHDKAGSTEHRKRTHHESLSQRCRKSVLLEKTNMTNHNNLAHYPHDQDFTEATVNVSSSPTSKLKISKSSALAEIKKSKSQQSSTEDITQENPFISTLQLDREAVAGLQSDSSALLWSAHAEQKSAFCKPTKLSITEDHQQQRPVGVSSDVLEQAALAYKNMLSSHLFQGDMSGTQRLSSAHLSAGSFHYAPEVLCRNSLQTATLLPPTLSSMSVTVQNWCAKCNLSFRMTSDLVFHMRSHHKKEFAEEAQGRRRRDEKLICPVCHEYFRERHHLSRHMTSHN